MINDLSSRIDTILCIIYKVLSASQVLSRLVSSALSRIEECRRLKAKEKENAAGSDCGSSQSDDSYSDTGVKLEAEKDHGGSDSSSDDGSSL